jgi:ATP-binding cassette subfamily B protein
VTSSVRSFIPGRARLDVPSIRGDRAMAAAAEEAVAATAGVTAATASAVTGTVLVQYDPALDWGALHAEIDARLDALDPATARFHPAARGPLQRVLRRSLPDQGSRAGPVLLTVGAHSLNMLQNLVVVTGASVVNGDTPTVLRWLGVTDVRAQLTAITTTGLALTTVEGLVQHRRRRAWQEVARGAEERLRSDVFARLEAQDLAFFHADGTGSLLNVLTADVDSIGALVESTDVLLETALTALVGGSVLLRTSPTLALVAGTAGPLVAYSIRRFGPRTRDAFIRASRPSSRLTQALENILSGIVEVKSFTAEEQEARRVARLSRSVAESGLEAGSAATLQATFTEKVLYLAGATALGYGARLAVSGRVARPTFTRTMYWIPAIVGAVGSTVQLSRTYYRATAGVRQINRVLDAVPAIHSGPAALDPAAVRGELQLEGVSFAYEPPRRVLRDVSLHVPGGTSLGVVGPNGSGKSTLLRLLLRFYEPDAGRILLDGHDVRDLRLADLRASVSLVSQDVYVFDDTLAHNVRYGRPDAGDDEVVAALAAAGASSLLDELPDGLATRLGERGHRLSGGQRQRVALARALLKGAPVLALDEATSHLDYEAEAAFKETLRTTASGRTVVLIAHRLSSVRDLDQIVVLDRGEIREHGSHDELLDQRGLYHRLWQLQRP